MVTVADTFWEAVIRAEERPEFSGPGFEGARLSWAAGQVLQGDGAGLSLSVDQALRFPWGASNEAAALAEQFQFTAGQGPCLDAFSGGQAVMASRLVISRFWPGFAESFLGQTPFRSVFATPIGTIGVLDVFFRAEQGALAVDVGVAEIVAREIWLVLSESESLVATDPQTGALSATNGPRSQVPVAVGVLVAALELTAPDALAVLRAHAFAGGRSVDDVAVDVVDGRLDPKSFTDGG